MISKPIPWADEEEALLREKFIVSNKKELLDCFPNRTYKSICGKAEKLKINKGLIHQWSKEDDEKLIKNYKVLNKMNAILLFPNRTWVSIQSRANKLKIRKYNKNKDTYESWTDENLTSYAESRKFTFVKKFKDEKSGKYRVEVICENGHNSTPPLGSFVKGNDCRKCTGADKLTLDEIKPKIEEREYKLISTTYIDSASELILECPNEHEWNTSWDSFRSGANCIRCYQDTIGDR